MKKSFETGFDVGKNKSGSTNIPWFSVLYSHNKNCSLWLQKTACPNGLKPEYPCFRYSPTKNYSYSMRLNKRLSVFFDSMCCIKPFGLRFHYFAFPGKVVSHEISSTQRVPKSPWADLTGNRIRSGINEAQVERKRNMLANTIGCT